MAPDRPSPWLSVCLAALGTIAILASGAQWPLAAGVLMVWLGSLWLILAAPPRTQLRPEPDPFTRANMSELVEFSGTPVLIMERGKIAAANRAARKLLGKHIIGQDARVGLRHPKAIKLLESEKSGFTKIRGLSRRKDVWRINKQSLSNGLSLIELLNRTAEEDVGRAHTDFVANASHELRTPLSSIIGYVETIRDGGASLDTERKNKFLDTILSESNRLQSLVSDLISLSRIEAEKHEQPQTPADLSELTGRTAREVASLGGIDRLVLEVEPGLVVAGDERQLEQLVRNLVDNAFKYGGPAAPVTIGLHVSENDEAILSVTDQGDGIAAEHIPHLTRRFYRTDPSRSRASGGTGLGLAIVKHIVERHRGRLDISSELGQGTNITVRIPILDR